MRFMPLKIPPPPRWAAVVCTLKPVDMAIMAPTSQTTVSPASSVKWATQAEGRAWMSNRMGPSQVTVDPGGEALEGSALEIDAAAAVEAKHEALATEDA